MKRAHQVKTAGHWDQDSAVDAIVLDAHERHRRRVVLSGERGTKFLLDLPQAIFRSARPTASASLGR
jgi:urease accessory protein